MTNTQPLIDAVRAAEILGVSTWRIHQLVREGLLPAVRIGRSVKFSPAALDAWIERGGQSLPGGWRRDPRRVEA